MIAVVTGGSGFIGQNLVRRLLHDGHQVRCLVRPSGGMPPHGAQRYIVRFDDPRSLLACAAFDGASAVFHLAGVTRAVGLQAFLDGNVTPTRHLLGAISARRLQMRFVLVSSQAAAGPAPGLRRPVDEDDPPRPVELYGRSKLEAERVVESFSDRVAVTVVRPCSTFGAHDRDFHLLFRMARRGVVVYPGTADHWMSVLHVDDVVDGLLAAAERERAISRTYFLASGEPVQWRAFGELVATSLGRRARHIDLPTPMVRAASWAGELFGRLTRTTPLANQNKAGLAEQQYWVCSAARARAELGFRESRSLPDAVRATYFWYRNNGWLRESRRAGSAIT